MSQEQSSDTTADAVVVVALNARRKMLGLAVEAFGECLRLHRKRLITRRTSREIRAWAAIGELALGNYTETATAVDSKKDSQGVLGGEQSSPCVEEREV